MSTIETLTTSGFASRNAIRALLVSQSHTGEKSFVTRVCRIGLVSSLSDSVWRNATPGGHEQSRDEGGWRDTLATAGDS